jgi:hypothetical protein
MLDPGWIRAHHREFDVFHLHFGFDAQSPAALGALVAELRRFHKPLVYTVHDLRNPHQRDPGPHRRALDVLVPAADRLITLTPGAADEINGRWGRASTVLPHPHVVDEADLRQGRSYEPTFVVGLHLKSLRPNMAALPVLRALVSATRPLPGAVLRVDVHPEIADPAAFCHAPEVVAELQALAESEAIELHVHDYFSDPQLVDYLRSLDLSVLPYTFGTHSGWLEECYDLGTAVMAPDCGYYRQQHPCLTYHTDDGGPDEDSLRSTLLRAYAERPRWRADPDRRLAEQRHVAAAQDRLYQELLT